MDAAEGFNLVEVLRTGLAAASVVVVLVHLRLKTAMLEVEEGSSEDEEGAVDVAMVMQSLELSMLLRNERSAL